MLRYIFSILILSACLVASSQDTLSIDSSIFKSKKKPIIPVVMIKYNLARLGLTAAKSGYHSHEIQGSFGINTLFVTVDLGLSDIKRGKDYTYTNTGYFGRIGIDANVSSAWKNGNIVAFGGYYGRAVFQDHIRFQKQYPNGHSQDFDMKNNNVTARWFELAFKLQTSLWKNLILGSSVRYKFFSKVRGEGAFMAYEIPGFGQRNRANTFGFDVYLGWSFSFRKKNQVHLFK